MLKCDGLDLTTEKCVPLVQPIKRAIQLSDNCLGLIGDDDQFNIDLLYSIGTPLASKAMPTQLKAHRSTSEAIRKPLREAEFVVSCD